MLFYFNGNIRKGRNMELHFLEFNIENKLSLSALSEAVRQHISSWMDLNPRFTTVPSLVQRGLLTSRCHIAPLHQCHDWYLLFLLFQLILYYSIRTTHNYTLMHSAKIYRKGQMDKKRFRLLSTCISDPHLSTNNKKSRVIHQIQKKHQSMFVQFFFKSVGLSLKASVFGLRLSLPYPSSCE